MRTVSPASAPTPATVDTGFDRSGRNTCAGPAGHTDGQYGGRYGRTWDADLDARVAALLPNKSITDWNAIQAFMAHAVPWPGTVQDPGYVNLHYSSVDRKNPTKLYKGGGWPFRSVEALIDRASWINATTQFKDVWYCLSLQSQVKPNAKNPQKPKAQRLSANALAVKSLWIDADVGDKKQYKTIDEALKALILFREKHGLPQYSALVASGSGLHAYWISKTALTVRDWAPYAEGLRTLLIQDKMVDDPGITTDVARILRVPGTFNHKAAPPKLVVLLDTPLVMHDFSAQLALLPTLAPAVSTVQVNKSPEHELFVDQEAAARFAIPSTIKIDDGTSLQGGIDKHEDVLLDPTPIFKQCGFYQDALLTGGENYDNALWMYSVLGATFLENGNAIAHAISQGHSTYSKDGTQALYDRKVADRADRGIGYPSCSAIAGAGCEACKTCPLFNKIKSPLNLANRKPSDGQSNEPGHSGTPKHSWADPLDFEAVPVAEAVARINDAGYFVLTFNGDIYKKLPGGGVVVQKREGFTNLFACRQCRLDDGRLINAGTAWKSSPERREYDSVGYWPSNHDQPDKSYNLWRGWGVEPKEGDWSIIHDLILDVIADGDLGRADFILNWLAHMVRRPWEKPGVALVLRGRKGTGKSLLVGIVARAIGKSNTLTTANGKSLFGTFNWHLADKLLICAEEAFFAGNREQNDQLKHLLTGGDIEVEQKYGQRLTMKSMHRLLMSSNHNQVVAASDDERRFEVNDVSDKRKGDDLYFAPLVRVLNGEDDATLAAFMHELTTRDIKGWKAEQAARNIAREGLARQKLLSLEPPLQWLLEQTEVGPNTATMQTVDDIGAPTASDITLTQRTAGLSGDKPQGSRAAGREQSKTDVLNNYRHWAKNTQVRGAIDYNGAENFWLSIKRLLNSEIFPGRRLFRNSGGSRFVIWPPPQELIDGFNQLLGGKVVGDNTGDDDGPR